MAFEFRAGQSIDTEFRRVLEEELDGAVEKLSGFSEGPDPVIHEVRKHNKRVRSLFRILKPVFGKEAVREANALVRDAAKCFSDARDALVRREICDGLIERFPLEAGKVRDFLEARHLACLEAPELPAFARQASDDFAKTKTLLVSWPWDSLTKAEVGEGVVATFAKGIEDFAQARESRDPEQCHDWRKVAKYLSYHLTLFTKIAPTDLTGQIEDATVLASLLGEHHDLQVLADYLAEVEGMIDGTGPVIDSCKRRQEEIEKEAFALGETVYGGGEERFRNQLGCGASR